MCRGPNCSGEESSACSFSYCTSTWRARVAMTLPGTQQPSLYMASTRSPTLKHFCSSGALKVPSRARLVPCTMNRRRLSSFPDTVAQLRQLRYFPHQGRLGGAGKMSREASCIPLRRARGPRGAHAFGPSPCRGPHPVRHMPRFVDCPRVSSRSPLHARRALQGRPRGRALASTEEHAAGCGLQAPRSMQPDAADAGGARPAAQHPRALRHACSWRRV